MNFRGVIAALPLMFILTPCVYAEEVQPVKPIENLGPEALIKDGAFFGELRYRYEHVDQDGISNKADASTVRTNLGFKTGQYYGFRGLIEAQIVNRFGGNDFNDTTNGKTTYPIVADPQTAEINELWLSWSAPLQTEFKIGRQKINLDNQRFVGTVDWRQNDQTFDGIMLTNTSLDKLELQYSFIRNVNRVFGDDHPLGDLDTTTHLAHASYKYADWFNAALYGYWMNFDEAPSLSNRTYGARINGKVPLNDVWSVSYEAEAAMQEDHGDNTAHYDEGYYHVSPGITGYGFTVTGGYEVLQGDGSQAFQTPLATLHKFNGWADKFLTTPANGLEDTYVGASYKVDKIAPCLNGISLSVVYHDFSGEEDGDYGSEWDASVGKNFTLPKEQPFEGLNVLVKYADYDADDTPYTDTKKIWLQVGTKF